MKRKSTQRSPTHEPRDFAFFTDRSIDSTTFAEPIVRAGYVLHRFPFKHDTPDEEWIQPCAEQGWIGLSGDVNITRTPPHELAAVMESGAALFVLKTNENTNHAILSTNFLRTADKIIRFFQRHPRPFVASVTRPNDRDWDLGRPGNVRMLRSYDDWLGNRIRRRSG